MFFYDHVLFDMPESIVDAPRNTASRFLPFKDTMGQKFTSRNFIFVAPSFKNTQKRKNALSGTVLHAFVCFAHFHVIANKL